ncbi:endonuclease/exonuclease/phosphatase family protein [Nocardioides houyundeii]|uniref:endonuclease/exonuclease/phosphatase family protein n=1 Tax=Nocardioides houyundeii TaxID=2045452 RepID=UPI000C7781D0|nr:endonuclease/exonuclease/phosphatase family protein [Nocardioides houyundeii]
MSNHRANHRDPRPAQRPAPGGPRQVSLPSWRVLATVLGLVLVLGLMVVPGRALWGGQDTVPDGASAPLGPQGSGSPTGGPAAAGPTEQATDQAAGQERGAGRTEGQAEQGTGAAGEGQEDRAGQVSRALLRDRPGTASTWAFAADLHQRTKVAATRAKKRQVERIAARQAAARKKKQQQRRKAMARRAQMAKTSTFRVGSLNILGSQHTRGAGGYGPGPERAGISAGLVTSRGVDVVGLQEVQDDQLPVLLNRLPGYTVWPQHQLGSNGQRLQIAWRDSRFELLDTGSVSYVFDSQTIPLPFVLLRDRETQAQFWVITTHNSARDLEGQRDAATARQISLIKELQARNGKPVLIMGDVNEHEEFFYSVCGATGFLAANGGGVGCSLPPRPLRVDWIMGGGGGGVSFSGYVQDGASLARASDHYFIHAAVQVTDPGEQ